MEPPGVPPGRRHEKAERLADESGPFLSEHGTGRQVGFEQQPVGVEDQVADGGKIEEIGVPPARLLQLSLGLAHLLVLHLQLDLVDAQLVYDHGHVGLGHLLGRDHIQAELVLGLLLLPLVLVFLHRFSVVLVHTCTLSRCCRRRAPQPCFARPTTLAKRLLRFARPDIQGSFISWRGAQQACPCEGRGGNLRAVVAELAKCGSASFSSSVFRLLSSVIRSWPVP